tara:strand:+ start:119 stop:655 length:537 start_codon:yes stop_codon:yes gene_type:complete
MAQTLFNHNRRILDQQPARVRRVYPGTILRFNYRADRITDKKPMILVLWNDYYGNKIHGINLNYLTEYKIKVLMQRIVEKGKSPITVEDQDSEDDYDDSLPFRNLLKDPYTRIKLPTYKEERVDGNQLSKSEAQRQMEVLYERVLKKTVKKEDIYRTYKHNNMASVKAITYDLEGLLK